MQQPTRLGFRCRLGFGQWTMDCGQWRVKGGGWTADSSKVPFEGRKRRSGSGLWLAWESVDRGKEKSSQVKSSQVASRNLFHLSWFLERFTHSQKHKTSAIARPPFPPLATKRSFEAFPSKFPPPSSQLGGNRAHTRPLPVSRWSAARARPNLKEEL